MIDLGIVKPGATVNIPFGSYTGSTGASSAASNYAAADILVYKNGSDTQRASSNGLTATTTFDSVTGINLCSINLADNSTAGFWEAGADYFVIVGPITVDSQTVNFPIAHFTIGMPGAVLNTSIASLSSQTSFTLTNGPAEDDALNGCVVYIHDVASAVQGGFAVVSDYTGASKTVTLLAGTTFTAAATDNISVFPPSNARWAGSAATTAQTGDSFARLGAPAGASVSADIAAVKVDTAAILVDTNELQTDWVNGGRLDLLIDAIKAKTDNLPADPADASDVAAAIAALNDLSAAEVNAEVVDALATDTYAEPTGVPAATATLAAKISTLYMIARNGVTVTSSKMTFLDDGGAGEFEKDLSDDGTTYAETKANAI